MRKTRRLVMGLALGLLAASPAGAQVVGPTPQTLQQYIYAVPFQNGMKAITGVMLQNNLQTIHDILAGMGTWDSNGVYSPNLNSGNIIASLGYTPYSTAGGELTGPLFGPNVGATPTGGCDTGAWTGTPIVDGVTNPALPLPSCYASKMTPTVVVPFAGLAGIGTVSGVSGDQTHDQLAQLLVQARTALGNTKQENAIAYQFRSMTGGGVPDTTHGDYSEKTGLIGYCTAEGANSSDPNGAANTWCINLDLVLKNGFTRSGYMAEWDMTNFAGPYGGGTGLGTSGQEYSTLTGFPITYLHGWQATANSAGATVTLTSGQTAATVTGGTVSVGDMLTGTGIPAYTYVQSIGGSTSAVNGTGAIVLTQAPTGSGSTAVTRTTFGSFLGLNFASTNLVRDSLISDGTNAKTEWTSFGTHLTGFDTQNASLTYALITASGQQICLKNATFCLGYDTGTATLASSGNFKAPLVLADTYYANGTNNLTLGNASYGGGFQVQNLGSVVINYFAAQGSVAGFGPTFKVLGGDTNIQMNLQAKGTGAVAVLSPLVITSGFTASALPTAGGAVRGTVCSDTTGLIYVKTTTGACL